MKASISVRRLGQRTEGPLRDSGSRTQRKVMRKRVTQTHCFPCLMCRLMPCRREDYSRRGDEKPLARSPSGRRDFILQFPAVDTHYKRSDRSFPRCSYRPLGRVHSDHSPDHIARPFPTDFSNNSRKVAPAVRQLSGWVREPPGDNTSFAQVFPKLQIMLLLCLTIGNQRHKRGSHLRHISHAL